MPNNVRLLPLPPFVAACIDLRAIDPASTIKVLFTHYPDSRIRAGMDRRGTNLQVKVIF